jgi:hypothetical protein
MATSKTKLAAAKKIAQKLKAKKSASSKKTTTSSKSTTPKKDKKETLSSTLAKQGQNRPQNPSSYTTSADKMESAQNVGWRWTEQGAKKLGKTLSSKPSAQDIKNYANKTFKIARKPNIASTSHEGDGSYRYLYSERRINKSDYNRKAKFENGGEMVDVSLYRKGGQTMGQHERKFGVMDRAMDKDWMAKPVGWRYTNAKAKRLGVDEYSSPTQSHIDKYRGKGVYFENRRDKSDKNPSMGYAKGGQTMGQNESQFGWRSEKDDRKWMAKPVGWRYTNAKAKRLRVDEYAKPTIAHIEKYRGNGVYFENRRDKSDLNPSSGR